MDHTDEIKQRLDLADLIGEYVTLKPAGSGSMKAPCPFHREKTPSFYVSREKQIWHCFGCGVGGDHFDFVMQMEGIDFPESLRQLAEKAGVEIKRFVTEQANSKTRIIKLLDIATRFYHKCLLDTERAQIARDYIARRAVGEELVQKFMLGYAPDRWDALLNFLKKYGFREQEILDAGLAIKRQDGSGIYDRFRHRIMFPIHDIRGNAVGFTGRLLDEKREEGKYINTPQTEVYNKSQVLYGLFLAKLAIKTAGQVIIVEGNMDVIASHKAGVENVVASSGTALTNEQLGIMRRFTENILVCFDADSAGQSAAKRGIDAALMAGMVVKVVTITGGVKDPDDLVKINPELWKEAVSNATDAMTYYFKKVFAGGTPKTAIEKKKAGDLLLPEIAKLQNPIEREHWMRQLSLELGVTEAALAEELVNVNKKVVAKQYENENKGREVLKPGPNDRRTKLAETLLAMLFSKKSIRNEIMEILTADHLPDPYQALYLLFVSMYHEHNASDSCSDEQIKLFFANFRKQIITERTDFISIFDRLTIQGEREYQTYAVDELRRELSRIIEALKNFANRDTFSILARELRDAENTGDENKVQELTKKFNELI